MPDDHASARGTRGRRKHELRGSDKRGREDVPAERRRPQADSSRPHAPLQITPHASTRRKARSAAQEGHSGGTSAGLLCRLLEFWLDSDE